MSPRRRFTERDAGENAVGADYFRREPRPPRRWGLPIVAIVAAVLMAAAIAASTFMLVRHEDDRRVA
ncbi:mammalian cell entry protein, partial [Mycobacterium sp. ITM-2017-0098]